MVPRLHDTAHVISDVGERRFDRHQKAHVELLDKGVHIVRIYIKHGAGEGKLEQARERRDRLFLGSVSFTRSFLPGKTS